MTAACIPVALQLLISIALASYAVATSNCPLGNVCDTSLDCGVKKCDSHGGCTVFVGNDDDCETECMSGRTCNAHGMCEGGHPTEDAPCGDVECGTKTCDKHGKCSKFTPDDSHCAPGSDCESPETCSHGSCIPGPSKDGEVCEAFGECGVKKCESGACTAMEVDDAACGKECMSGRTCNAHGMCEGGHPTPDAPCGEVECGTQTCDKYGSCSNFTPDDSHCDPGSECTSPETCSHGSCIPGPSKDGNDCGGYGECGIKKCETGECKPMAVDDALCDEPCKIGQTCDAHGMCVGGTNAAAGEKCDTFGICGVKECDAHGGCTVKKLQNIACGEATDCKTAGECNMDGTCKDGVPTPDIICETTGECSLKRCDEAGECSVSLDLDVLCGDATACRAAEKCMDGVCQPGEATPGVPCGMFGDCGLNKCDDHGECSVAEDDPAKCDGETECTEAETCSHGNCLAGANKAAGTTCGEFGDCGKMKCDGHGMCEDKADDASLCAMETECTEAETCVDGECHPGAEKPGCKGCQKRNEPCEKHEECCEEGAVCQRNSKREKVCMAPRKVVTPKECVRWNRPCTEDDDCCHDGKCKYKYGRKVCVKPEKECKERNQYCDEHEDCCDDGAKCQRNRAGKKVCMVPRKPRVMKPKKTCIARNKPCHKSEDCCGDNAKCQRNRAGKKVCMVPRH